MTTKIKILDCTLRDGGYIIDWTFGKKNILSIINSLAQTGIDYIECGFLKQCQFNTDKTFYDSLECLQKLIPTDISTTLMINFGEYDISNFKQAQNSNIKIRFAFKKQHQTEALKYIDKLTNMGYEVFANPMSTNTYSPNELCLLINDINKINPKGICIVDTLGNMYEKQVINIFKIIDEKLRKDISLGFHSHNSLQLSFSNTKALLKMNLDRELIIDSCLYGMGRGAGNLCTELITKYLNDNYNAKYDLLPLLKTIDENIKPLYKTTPWGYSTPYYIAAINGCHPNYASELVKKNFSDEEINSILSQIPNEEKTSFNINFLTDFLNSKQLH